jgi:hypothetical protein
MSLPSAFQASGPLPSATFAGWDTQTEQQALWTPAGGGGGGGSAVGPAGAIQFSDGAGAFQGTANGTVDAAGAVACQSLATVALCAVGGNATVAGTLSATGLCALGANLTIAGNQNTLGQATIGAVGDGLLFSGTHQLVAAGRFTNAAGINVAPGAVGMSGTRSYSVAAPASTNNIDIGLSALINDSVPHLFSVSVRTNDAPGAAFVAIGLIQSFPAAQSLPPILTAASTANGYALTSVTGTPGAYTLNMNSSLGSATTALVNITIIF